LGAAAGGFAWTVEPVLNAEATTSFADAFRAARKTGAEFPFKRPFATAFRTAFGSESCTPPEVVVGAASETAGVTSLESPFPLFGEAALEAFMP
jgi:hypothetical protein